MQNHNKLSAAVRTALYAGTSAGVLAGVTLPQLAQAQSTEPTAQDEIIVTGSRIRRPDLETASPVSVVTADEMRLTGITDVGDLLQRMPSMSGSPIGTTTNNGGDGSVQIDLRGLGVDRTLTMINGQRMVDGGDYQTIPAAMIERVEILKDGASAVYGADAVAGVVNIITKDNFDGLSIDVQNANFFDTDRGRQNTLSLVAGKTFDGGNFIFGAEYVDQEEAYQSDTPWGFMQDSYYIYPEGCEAHPTLPYTGSPDGGCYPLGSSRIPEAYLGFKSQGTYMVEDPSVGLVPYDGHTYNYAPVNLIQTPYKRTNMYAKAEFDLSDTMTFNATYRGNLRQSEQNGAPQPYDSRLDPGYAGVFNGEAYNGISEQNYYLVQAVTAAGLAVEPVTDARRRMVEIPRLYNQDVTQHEVQLGLSGTMASGITWDMYYNRGQRSQTDTDSGQFVGARLNDAMGPSADLDGDGVPECYTDLSNPNTLISGCVPFNFFGGPGAVTKDMLDYVGADLNDTRTTKQTLVGYSLSGDGPELGGGRLGWAAGVGYWAQSFAYAPDSGKAVGAVTGNKSAGTDGSLYSNNIFAEVRLPVTSKFEANVGVRRDDYNIFGSDNTWQVGVIYDATSTFKIRASAGTVFRAPTIEDLFDGLQDDFPTYSDPCATTGTLPPGCAQLGVQDDSQVLAKIGGNALLVPETGDTRTVGIVWTPDIDGDLSLTVDYWDTQIDQGISSYGVQFILDDCYERQNPASCALVTRRSNYSVAQIIDLNVNVAEQGVTGVDTEFRYRFGGGRSQYEVSFLWSHLMERRKVAFPGAAETDLSGRFTDPTAEDGGAYAEDKINYTFQWYLGDLSIGLLGEYISGLDADTFCNCGPVAPYIQKIDSQLYHDIVLNYEFGRGSQLGFGVTNVTNEAPPYIEVGFNATTDPSTYRMFGRGYYFRFTQRFQ